jgi:hypothetical protein
MLLVLGAIALVAVIVVGVGALGMTSGGTHTSPVAGLSASSATGSTAPRTTPTVAPTPTPTPTMGVIMASHDPLTIGGFTFQIAQVTLSPSGIGGFVPSGLTSGQTALAVEATLVSGGTLTDLSQLAVWVTDETGSRYDTLASLTVAADNNAIWMFAVPETSAVFLWWFPSGEVVGLTSLIAQGPEVTPTPTESGTPWDVFSAYTSAETDKEVADNQAWNKASNPSTTYAAATKMKADAQADLAWLKAHPPLACYTTLNNDLVAYHNQNIKGMNDWFAGKYANFNNVDQPALSKIWLRLDSESSDADTACS